MDGNFAQVAVPLAAAGISAYAPRRGGAAVQAGLGAMGALQNVQLDKQRVQDLDAQRQRENTLWDRTQQGWAREDQQYKDYEDWFQGVSGSHAGAGGQEPAAQGVQIGTGTQIGLYPKPTQPIGTPPPEVLAMIKHLGPQEGYKAYAAWQQQEHQKQAQPTIEQALETGKQLPEGAEYTTETPTGKISLHGPKKAEIPPDLQAIIDSGQATNVVEAMKVKARASQAPQQPPQLSAEAARFFKENPNATAEDWQRLQRAPSADRRIDIMSNQFHGEQVVKETQQQAQAVAFAESLDLNTKNPADDQGLIYSFAKAMDPNSVVREGEYATVQKYAQSWLEQFGFNAKRVLSNTEFLTPQARQNMRNTIRAKFEAGRAQYDNVKKEYANRIDLITGEPGGEKWLIGYEAAFPGLKGQPKAAPQQPGQGGPSQPGPTQQPGGPTPGSTPSGGTLDMKDGTSWKKDPNGQWQRVK